MKDFFDYTMFSSSKMALELYSNAIRAGMEYDIFQGKENFKVKVLTDPMSLDNVQSSAFFSSKSIKKLLGIEIGKKTNKFVFKGRIDEIISPHIFLPDPCSEAYASNHEEASKIISMHTTFVSKDSSFLDKVKIGDIVNVKLKGNVFSYNLQYGVFEGLVSPSTAAQNEAKKNQCQSLSDLFSDNKFTFQSFGFGGGGGAISGTWKTTGEAPCTGERTASPLPSDINPNSAFGSRGGTHFGVDFACDTGTPVYSIANGTVYQMLEGTPCKIPPPGVCGPGKGGKDGKPICRCGGGWGNFIKILHTQPDPDGRPITSIYAHMSAYAPGLTNGATVTAGQQIGEVGNTGNTSGAHLHLEVRIPGSPYAKGRRKGNIDPISYMKMNQVGVCASQPEPPTTEPQVASSDPYPGTTENHGEDDESIAAAYVSADQEKNK